MREGLRRLEGAYRPTRTARDRRLPNTRRAGEQVRVSLGTGFGDSFARDGRVSEAELVAGELHHETQLVLACGEVRAVTKSGLIPVAKQDY